jgi:hypothetical protein
MNKENGFSLLEILVALTLTVLVVVYLGTRLYDAAGGESAFDRTVHTMEEIREAILGRPGYANGVRQFTGYVADMGNLPSLYTRTDGGAVRVDYATADLESIFDGTFATIVQPVSLWTRDIDGDGRDDIPDNALWQYHADHSIWAGWKGPYIAPPAGGVLRDGWGKPLIFVNGELVNVEIKDPGTPGQTITRTYRCTRTHQSRLSAQLTDLTRKPGTSAGSPYWQEISLSGNRHIDVYAWVAGGKDVYVGVGGTGSAVYEDIPLNNEYYYHDALAVISYGRDGEPGGDGMDKDLILNIYSQQYTGEVGGHAAFTDAHYTRHTATVTLHYPDFTEDGGRVKAEPILIENNDAGYGINFRFGAALAVEPTDDWICEDCDTSPPEELCECDARDDVCKAAECTVNHSAGWVYTKDMPAGYRCLDEPRPWAWGYLCDEVWLPSIPMLGTGKPDPKYDCECLLEATDCIRWRCEEIPANTDCICKTREDYGGSERMLDVVHDPNSAELAVPIGIRSISTDSRRYIVPVDEGMNWIGTVK